MQSVTYTLLYDALITLSTACVCFTYVFLMVAWQGSFTTAFGKQGSREDGGVISQRRKERGHGANTHTSTCHPGQTVRGSEMLQGAKSKQRGRSSWLSPLLSLCPPHIPKMPYGFGKINQILSWNRSFNPCMDEAAGGVGYPGQAEKGLGFSPGHQRAALPTTVLTEGWIHIQRN